MILQNNNYDATNLNFGHKKNVFSLLVMGSIGPLLVKLLLGRLPKSSKINANAVCVQKSAKISKK